MIAKFVIMLAISLSGFFLVLPVVMKFLPDLTVRVPTSNPIADEILATGYIENDCDVLKCSNIYVLFGKRRKVQQDTFFCASEELAPNVRFTSLDIANTQFGVVNINCEEEKKIPCLKDSSMIEVAIFSILPQPKELKSFFVCR